LTLRTATDKIDAQHSCLERDSRDKADERLAVMEDTYRHALLDIDDREMLHDRIVKLRRKLGR
jgi:hypothetical protein